MNLTKQLQKLDCWHYFLLLTKKMEKMDKLTALANFYVSRLQFLHLWNKMKYPFRSKIQTICEMFKRFNFHYWELEKVSFLLYSGTEAMKNRSFLKLFIYYSFRIIYLMCISILVPQLSGGQKKALDSLELHLQTVVRHHTGAGTCPQVLCKRNRCC